MPFHSKQALKDTLGDKLYDAYISSMLTPFSIDEVRLMERKTLYQVSTKCGNDKTFYRFGFNGQEKDNELKGKGNVMAYEARINDARLGRWLSLDAMAAKYPSLSPYCSNANNPIYLIDPSGDTVTVHVTATKVGTTKINLFSSGEVKDIKDKKGKVISKGITQKTKEENVYQVDLINESGSTATFYFTRIAHRGDKDNPDADPSEVTFDPSTDGEIFGGELRKRWSETEYDVLELTPASGKREDGYNSYKGLDDDRQLINRKYVQLHIKGASDGCLLNVGYDQFETTESGITIDQTSTGSVSKDAQSNFISKIQTLQTEDKNAGKSDNIIIKVDQLKKTETSTATDGN